MTKKGLEVNWIPSGNGGNKLGFVKNEIPWFRVTGKYYYNINLKVKTFKFVLT